MVQQMQSRVRRVRARGARASLTGSAKLRALEESLKSIAKTMVDIQEMQQDLERQQAELFEAMKKNKVPKVEVEKAVAEIKQKMGRAVNTVDPKKFFNAVPREDFFSAVSVSITEAKKVLPEKTLDKITDHKPATLGPEIIEVKLRK